MKKDDVSKIDAKLDKLDERLDRIDVTLAAQHESLKDHIRRTELLEADVRPIKKHVAMMEGAVKLIGGLALIGGIIEGLMALMTYMRH